MPTHNETRILRYSAQQMYDLVADVEAYPQFLPWCAAARVQSVTPDGTAQVMAADLVISFKVFRERFGSKVVLHPDDFFIDTEYLDGPFKYMKSTWKFEDDPDVPEHGATESRHRGKRNDSEQTRVRCDHP
mgnify:CR=1 FL=1